MRRSRAEPAGQFLARLRSATAGGNLRTIRDQLRNLALIGVVMLGLLWAMGRYVSDQNRQPIQSAQDGVEAISRGTYDGPLDAETGDEFEDLAAAVHRNGRSVAGLAHRAESLNAELTHRVERRPRDYAADAKLELSERLATLGKVASGSRMKLTIRSASFSIVSNAWRPMPRRNVPDEVARIW